MTLSWELFYIYFNTINWRDCIEIAFFSTVIYYFSLWLKQDTQKNLIFPFYGYCILGFVAYYTDLTSISHMLFVLAPIALMLFMMIHEKTLQKNMILLKRIEPPQEITDWFDELIKASLHALNQDKEIICVIECNDRLKNLIQAPCTFYADIKKDIFDILLEKHAYGTNAFIWLNKEGKFIAINAFWRITTQQEWISSDAQKLPKWKQDALFISSKSDVLIFKITPLTRTFDIVLKGKLIEDLSPNQACSLLQKQLAAQDPVTLNQSKIQKSPMLNP